MATPVPTLVGSIVETASDGSISIPNTTPPAAGDYLIACIAGYQSGGTRNLGSTPAGWTLRQSQSGDDAPIGLYTKTAEAADVSAGSFPFTLSSTADVMIGAIYKVNNIATGAEVGGSEIDIGTTSFTATTNVAATTAESLVLAMYVDAQNSTGAGTTSAYVSTPSLTWTERSDLGGNNGNPSLSLAIATAPNTGTSAITSRGATYSIALQQAKSIIIVLNGLQDATGTAALHSADADFFAPTASSGTTGTHALLSVDADFFSTSGRATSPALWTSQTKNDTTWTNQEKP